MTIEQKAKRYDEALKWMRRLYPTMTRIDKEDAEHFFPELRESEDERIRQFLYHTFTVQYLAQDKLGKWHGESVSNILAWLQKQKEFVSADFDDVWKTADCDELTAPLDKYSKNAIKEMCHAWYDKGIELERKSGLEKQGEQKPTDEEMKELLRTEYEKGRADAIAETQVSWSEEDEKMLGKCIDAASGYYDPKEKDSMKLWLKSLKDRVQPEQELSEDDLYTLEQAIKCVNNSGKLEVSTEAIEDWLKDLKQRITNKQ